MNLDALGNIGDFIGGLGVVLTLGYLAIQIRRNTHAARASAVQAVYSDATAFSRLVGSSESVAATWRKGCESPDELTDNEQAQFISLATALIRNCENMFTQFQVTGDDSESWEPWALSIRGQMSRPGLQWFWRARRQTFSARFRAYLDSVVEELDPNAK